MNKEEVKIKLSLVINNSQYIRVSENHPLELYLGKNEKGKNIFTIRINEADIEKATELVNGIDSVKIRKKKENER